jgi:hypothetical protein
MAYNFSEGLAISKIVLTLLSVGLYAVFYDDSNQKSDNNTHSSSQKGGKKQKKQKKTKKTCKNKN